MVDDYKESGNDPLPIYNQSKDVLDQMANVFGNNDELLRSQSTVTVYYLTFKKAMELNSIANVTRRGIIDFYESIAENRRRAEKDITQSNYELLEFERMSQQGTNDAYSIKERTRLLCEYLGIK